MRAAAPLGTSPIAVGLAIAIMGCAEQGRPYVCSCGFLTDYDDPSKHHVEVCAPSDERAPDVARGCAQLGAPAPVQSCTCSPMPVASSCARGSCRTTEP